jgi:uncharacterized membrane protein YtjA (UPF0391 family)
MRGNFSARVPFMDWSKPSEGSAMLNWALIFLVIALIAAAFGFGGIAAAATSIAQTLFFIFLVLFLVSLIAGLVRRGRL